WLGERGANLAELLDREAKRLLRPFRISLRAAGLGMFHHLSAVANDRTRLTTMPGCCRQHSNRCNDQQQCGPNNGVHLRCSKWRRRACPYRKRAVNSASRSAGRKSYETRDPQIRCPRVASLAVEQKIDLPV